MWALNKIPKVLHIYFGGNKLSYLRYMTIISFLRFNPDWRIKFYYPAYPQKKMSWTTFEQKYTFEGDDYFSKLPIKKIAIDFEKIGIDNSISEVYKSDFLRWYLLSTEGGWWSDIDILYFKSMEELCFNNEKNKAVDTGVCICNYGHSIGFMFGSKNNLYYKYIWDRAKENWKEENYQSIGSILSNKLFPTMESIKEKLPSLNVINIPMDVVYAYNAGDINRIYQSPNLGKYTANSIGLHWYAGHSLAGEFLQKTNGGIDNPKDCVLGKTLAYVTSRHFIEYINDLLNDESKVLDLGCGDKKLINILRGKHKTVDIWEKFKPDILWDLNNTPLPFENNSFDTILLIDIIEHLDKGRGKKLIEEAKRITKRNIIIFTPLWWTENLTYMNDPNSVYYMNPYEKHKSLWNREDFKGWKEITEITFIGDYYFGRWAK